MIDGKFRRKKRKFIFFITDTKCEKGKDKNFPTIIILNAAEIQPSNNIHSTPDFP